MHSLHFVLNEEVDLEERIALLDEMGYRRQNTGKLDSGAFSVRGGILDIFAWGFSFPVRVELFDRTVQTIQSYDPASGLALEPHKMVVILPVLSREARGVSKFNWNWGEKPIQPFVDVEPGDPVVHVSHGIGIFRGVEKIRSREGQARAHMTIEYDEQEMLYVPLDDLYLVQRYVAPGVSKKNLKLSKLGGKIWLRVREKARQGILSYAQELLELHAKREMLQGFAFPNDADWQTTLRTSFLFEETPDQARAIEETLKDMAATKPMDRLICGDVGYGKTEVAVRAVLRAIAAGKQAAILVPTTLLAEQHYETFSRRYQSFPVQVEMLSRFRTAAEEKEVLKRLADGSCDVVIGTHRILSKDVAFKDLGLVIIDEEQRFGVRHKEKLKKLRLMVDILTLTATPIPRTLYMALVGGRELSLVNTPPKNRVPIRTRVVEYDERLIGEAIRYELSRKGQIFFVHNRVEGIDTVAKKIKALAPEARLGLAHGQMDPESLERVMRSFIRGDLDVLVSTTIIESGIDIPNANTIFVNRAETYGLADLYQLRGRVGRYNRDAYAFFLISKGVLLTHDSQKRLSAIERHTHLGSGLSLAMEDLEIRGAGNLLGTEQSGFMTGIGFDLYCRLLKDAIESIKKHAPSPTD